jgi:hypothetical protein
MIVFSVLDTKCPFPIVVFQGIGDLGGRKFTIHFDLGDDSRQSLFPSAFRRE